MAQTYTVASLATTFASSKSMLTIFNGSGSGRVVRVYRIWLLNNQTAGVTGVLTTFEIVTVSASSGGTALTPVKHDSTNETPPSQILFATGATDTLASTLRRFVWCNDEPSSSSGTSDEFECLVPLNCVWDSGYGDTNVQPITLREGQGLTVRHTGTTTVGNVDIFVEFTISTT